MSQIKVKTSNGEFVRSDSLVYFEELAEAKELNRYNRSRAIINEGEYIKGLFSREAISFLEKVANEKFDKNVKIDFKGQGKEFKESSKQFYFLFLVSF